MRSKMTRITLDIPKAHHRQLKAKAAIYGKSMREILLESIEIYLAEDCCASPHIPNEDTVEAIREAKQGIGLIRSNDLEDFFKKLGM